jgi:shikimate dehydrogenase
VDVRRRQPWPNRDTVVCGSFAGCAGNSGATIMNAAFRRLNLNYLYLPFSVENIGLAISAMLTLEIRGAGITMPHKKEAARLIKNLGTLAWPADEIGAINTVVNDDGRLCGYNTDYAAARQMLVPCQSQPLTVLGNGGLAQAVLCAARNLKMKNVWTITRRNWADIKATDCGTVFNCTPVKRDDIDVDSRVDYIDCDVATPTGKKMAAIQAAGQFYLYTGQSLP